MRLRTIVISLLAVVVTVPALGAVSVLGWRSHLQHDVAERRKITGPNTIDVMETVQIGGIPQVIRIRGRSLDNPIILYVHGGPGTPMIPFAHKFEDYWEKDFTVVQWDQRGCGKTQPLSDQAEIAKTMSPDRMSDDVVELSNYLRKRFHKPKIFILGHSWGSLISTYTVLKHPEPFYAYIGTGQVADIKRNEELGYPHTLMLAEQMGVKDAIKDLKGLEAKGPYPPPGVWKGEALPIRQKWNAYFGESVFGFQSLAGAMATYAWESPDYTVGDVYRLMYFDDAVYRKLDIFLYNFNAWKYGTEFKIPVFMINGVHDWQANNQLAEEYFRDIKAPEKKFFLLNHASHAPMVEEPQAFANILIKEVRPLAFGPPPSASSAAGQVVTIQ